MQKRTVVALGDSITAAVEQVVEKRWVSIFAKHLRQRIREVSFQVINSGVGGDTSRQGLARLEADVLRHQPDCVIIEFGGNDATSNLEQHVSLNEFEANLEYLTTSIINIANAQPILMTFPPIIDEWHMDFNNTFYHAIGGRDRYVEQYRALTRKHAQAHKIPLIDIDQHLRALISKGDKSTYILADGIHLTEQGNRIVADVVFAFLKNYAVTANWTA